MNHYTAGQLVASDASFYDVTPALADPTTVTVTYRVTNTPGSTTLTYAGSSTPGTGYIYRTATGSYHLRLDSTPFIGYLIWSWLGSGANVQTVGPDSAVIHPNP